MLQDEFIGPPNIYRYRRNCDHTINELADSYIYFQSRKELNDPFDCYPKLLRVSDNESRLKKWGKDLLKKQYPKKTRQMIREEYRNLNLDSLKNNLQENLEEIVDKFGIGCFSYQPSNLMLWANYANFHKGVCLRFNTDNDPDFFDYLKEIDYQEELSSQEYLPGDSTDHLFYTKPEVWKMEQECRLIKKPLGKHHFNPDALVGIIFGKDTPKKFIFQVMDTCNNKYQNLTFYKSFPSQSAFGITMQEISE